MAKEQIVKNLNRIATQEEFLDLKKNILLEKSLKSQDPNVLLNASKVWQELHGSSKNVNKKEGTKSYFIDPLRLNETVGFSQPIHKVNYSTLRRMAKAPITRAILETRLEQVLNYSELTDNNREMGWTIRRKKNLFEKSISNKISDEEKREIERISKFIREGGDIDILKNNNLKESDLTKWSFENFNTFLRKIVPDSLILDQSTFEIIPNKKGEPVYFLATDGATYRKVSNHYYRNLGKEELKINNSYPNHVQILNEQVYNEFYPWELAFLTRNISTNIYQYGYGRSELEDLIQVVTWMLYGDQYNGNFFSQGAAPKGILKLSGNVNEGRLEEFKQSWRAQITGVRNAWKTPVLEAEKMDWIDLQKSNQDMQFKTWQDYLIQLNCALYKMDPSEIGFHLQGGNQGGLYNNAGDVKEKVKYSQEKGLKPLLKFIQSNINTYLINVLNKDYEFIFTGLGQDDEDEQLNSDIKQLGAGIISWEEVRAKYGFSKKLGKDDFLLNPYWFQYKQMNQEGNSDSNEAINGFGGNGAKPYDYNENKEEDEEDNDITNYFAKLLEGDKSEQEDKMAELKEKGINDAQKHFDDILSNKSKEDENYNPFLTDLTDSLNKLIN